MVGLIIRKKLIFFLLVFFLASGGHNAHCEDILVSRNGLSSSIAQAIKFAQPGDTILIQSGTYFVANIEIHKPLTLIGEENTILDGRDLGQIMLIKANNVTVSGLTFRNTPVSYIKDHAAIKLDSAFHCVIRNNTFENNFFSIYLARSAHIKVINNQIISDADRETASGNGIHLWYCKDILISNNRIDGHRDGIYFEFVEGSEIRDNTSQNNLRYGLHFMFSNKCNYKHNTFRHNGAGVAVMYTKNINMESNLFEDNWGSASYGLLLKEITDSEIKNNHFFRNTKGIYAESSNRIRFQGNTFEKNGWALKIMGNCLDNTFYKNNFIANAFDVATNTSNSFNTFDSNFWDNYNGYDLNRDGIGDVPHRPVSLFSYLVEQNEPSLVLIRSLFVSMLNVAESVLPVFSPETLLDNSPAMKRIR